ncbi:MAG: methylated-DNA--[protein]-cysteine S-methyltransferase, partial [Methylococcales bacterium]
MTNPVKTIPQRCVYSFVPSPFGPFTVVVCDLGVQSIQWPRTRESRGTSPGTSGPDRCDDHPILERLAAQLPEYFAGTRQCFDIPLVLNGTPFQNSVWNALQEIRYGHTMSYEEQAIR